MTSDITLKADNCETLSEVFNVVSDYTEHRSRDSSVMLWTGRPGFDSWQRQEGFVFSTAFRQALGTHPASYPMGTGVSSGGKAAGM
jgi:hypothetical protein